MRILGSILVSMLALPVCCRASGLAVHEWGTFTSLQDETGAAIGGINTDDEPVPHFVHRMANLLLLRPSEVPPTFFQGAPHCHPDVIMRLETPVIYFHPDGAESEMSPLDVRVKFRGGWLTEFFPNASVQAPGLQSNKFSFGPLSPTTVSELEWSGLRMGGSVTGPPTTEHVWTAPRAVKAADVQTAGGEGERFLFYRGVGNLPAPLRVSREAGGDLLTVRSQLGSLPGAEAGLTIRSLWLTEIKSDGRVAFRELDSIEPGADTNRVLLSVSPSFKEAEFSKANMGRLRTALRAALVSEGLYMDEADALLNTWELSYFKSPGLRLFFLVPRDWTDYYLPLEIPRATSLKRVMMGRIELVTPHQRQLLEKLAAQSEAGIQAEWKQLHDAYYGALTTLPRNQTFDQIARESLASLNIAVPPGYRAYLDLGRFRNALVLDEEMRRPTPGLKEFIKAHALQGYRPS